MIIKTENEIKLGNRKLEELKATGYIYNDKHHLKITCVKNENLDKEPLYAINNNVKIILSNEDIAEAEKNRDGIQKFGFTIIIVKNKTKSKTQSKRKK